MITFRPELIIQIFNGNKTVTRRSASSHFEPGQEHAILPGRGRPSMGRLVVTKVSDEQLGAITDAEAQLEGFNDVEEFKAYWLRLYADWKPEQRIKRVEFIVVQQTHRLCPGCDGAGLNPLPEPRGFDGEIR